MYQVQHTQKLCWACEMPIDCADGVFVLTQDEKQVRNGFMCNGWVNKQRKES